VTPSWAVAICLFSSPRVCTALPQCEQKCPPVFLWTKSTWLSNVALLRYIFEQKLHWNNLDLSCLNAICVSNLSLVKNSSSQWGHFCLIPWWISICFFIFHKGYLIPQTVQECFFMLGTIFPSCTCLWCVFKCPFK